MISPGTSSVDCGWTCIKHCAVNSQWKHFPVVLMATNPFFNKFFPRVFYSLTFGPAGWHFSFLILQPEENRRCSLQRCDAVFGVSLALVSALLCGCDEAELELRMSACVSVCYGEGDVSTWTRGPNSTLISNKSRRTAGSKRCRLLKDGFMPYEVWKMAFGSSRRRLPPRDSVTVAQEVQRLLASSSLSLAADANNEQTEIKLNIWPTL